MLYQRILLPLDGSEHSLRAVDHAMGLAKLGGEIIVCTVVDPIPNILGGDARHEAEEELQNSSKAILQPVLDRLKAENISARSVVRASNKASTAIVALIDELKVDLVVMGSRGRSDLEGLLLGSVTHRVLAITDAPVLVVN